MVALSLMLFVSANAMADDYLTAFVKPGETKQLAIKLKNATDYTAFQMKIALPAGLKFAGDPQLTDRKDATHKLEFNKTDDNNMSVVVYSYDQAQNKGNEALGNDIADLLLVDVAVDDANYVAKDIAVNDIVFVKKSDLTGDDLAVTSKGKLGDVDGNNKLNTVDASLILMKLVGKSIDVSYDAEAEDVDGDGKVNTVDATEILVETLRK
jgi:hypothetical protein